MKPCPVCGGAGRFDKSHDAPWVWCESDTCAFGSAQVYPMPLEAWDALPRIRPDAEALVDAFGKACIRRSFEGRVDATNSRAELLRACVVDAAEVAALRVQRDEAVAAVKKLTGLSARKRLRHAQRIVRALGGET